MSPQDIAILMFAYLVAGFVKGATGLGFSTSCLAILAFFFNVAEALPFLVIPSMVSNAFVMIDAGNFRATLARFWPMLVATLPGLAFGLWALSSLDPSWPKLVLGFVLAAYASYTLIHADFHLSDASAKRLAVPSGFLTGFVNGLTGSQVMPVMPYLLAMRLKRNMFLQAINCSFTLSSACIMAVLTALGIMTAQAYLLSAIGLVPAFAGVFAGTTIRKRMGDETFRKFVLIALLASGLAMIVRVMFG